MSRTEMSSRDLWTAAANALGIPVVDVDTPAPSPYGRVHVKPSQHPDKRCCAWTASIWVDGFGTMWCYGRDRETALRRLAGRFVYFRQHRTLDGVRDVV